MQSQAFGSEFEGLEGRLLLAGNITSVLAGGVLTLTGDALANQVQLTVGTNGQMVATGLTGTTINGLASVNFGAVNTLTFLGGAGNDSINLNQSGAVISGNVILDGGDGNDTISATGKFGANLNLLGGLGNDTLSVTNATVTNASATPVATNILINAGDGSDIVTVSNCKVGNTNRIDTGFVSGRPSTDDSTGNDDDVVILTGGNVTNVNDKETVTVSGLSVTDDLRLTDNHTGVDNKTVANNTFRITNTTARDDVTLVSLAANDTLTMTNVTSYGKVDLNFGDGTNTLSMSKTKTFGTAPSSLLVLGDGIIVNSGAGMDKLGIIESETAGVISINTGNGADRVELTRVTTTRSSGALDIDTGAGGDGLVLDRVSIGGNSTIDTGLDNDIFTLKNSRLLGTFDAELGDGSDLGFVGGNTFVRLNSYRIDGDTFTANSAFDILTRGSNTPEGAGGFTNFEVTNLGTF